MDRSSRYMDNPLRQNFFRAGHAHAGVIMILSLICQILADAAMLPEWLLWFVRIGVPAASILMGPGFFLSMPSPDALEPNRLVRLISVGAATLALSVVILGIGLLRSFAARCAADSGPEMSPDKILIRHQPIRAISADQRGDGS
jgi:hypothetical protein